MSAPTEAITQALRGHRWSIITHSCKCENTEVTAGEWAEHAAQVVVGVLTENGWALVEDLRAIIARGIESGNRSGGYYYSLRDALNFIDAAAVSPTQKEQP